MLNDRNPNSTPCEHVGESLSQDGEAGSLAEC